MVEILEVYKTHLKGLTAREIWQQPEKEVILAAVMTKLKTPPAKRGCLLCISEALEVLHEKIYGNMGAAKYKLKNVVIAKFGERLSNENLTDDKARRLLTKYPELINQFRYYPANWQDDIKGVEMPKEGAVEYQPEKEVKAAKKPRKTAKKELNDIEKKPE